MYTKCREPVIKEEIISCFSDQNGKLRIAVATIVFGMGLDCPMYDKYYTGGQPMT